MKDYLRCAARASVVAAIGLFTPIASHAFLVSLATIGDEFTVNFLLEDGAVDGNNNENTIGQDISAEVIFTHQSFDAVAHTLSLEVDVTNTTAPLENDVGLFRLLFGMDPEAMGVTLTHVSGEDKFNSANLTIHPNFGFLGISAGSTSQTSPGYPNTLNEGMQQVFRLDFTFSDIGDSVEFSPFGSWWQTAGDPDDPSFQVGGTEENGDNGDVIIGVPEPGSLALLGLGLLALTGVRRWFA